MSEGAKSILAEIGSAYGEQVERARSVASEAFRRANQRFEASREPRDSVTMLAAQDKRTALLKIAKKDGLEEAALDLGKEREPRYAVDAVTDRVYLQTATSTVTAYQL